MGKGELCIPAGLTEAAVHAIPSKTSYSGPARVRSYFQPAADSAQPPLPQAATGAAVLGKPQVAAFRGRTLRGAEVTLPAGFSGYFVRNRQKQMKDDPRTETPETPETPKTSETPKATETPKAPKAPVIKQTGNKEKDESEWEKANPRLAAVAKMRKAGASREEINKVLYNKGTKAYGAK